MKAALVITCMLACAMSPVITTWDGDGSDVIAADDGKFTYVSLGDSMVNGFGMKGYYDSNNQDNSYGFLVDVDKTYSHLLSSYLKGIYGSSKFEYIPMAISGTRTAELRTMLDPGFTGDWYTQSQFQNLDGSLDKLFAKLPAGYSKDADGLRAYYADTLSKADLVTYQYHYDFGLTLFEEMTSFIGMSGDNDELDFSIYLDEESMQTVDDLKGQVTDMIIGGLESMGLDEESSEAFAGFIDTLANAFAYVIVGYCVNFDANMELLLGLNPDMKILVVDSYNTFYDVDVVYGEYRIPVGDIYGLVMDTVNMYTKYFSEYSDKVYHVSLDEYPALYATEFMEATKNSDIDNNSKSALMAVLQAQSTIDPNGYVQYDMLDSYSLDPSWNMFQLGLMAAQGKLQTNHGNLTKFLSYVFNSGELNWDYLTDPSLNITEEASKLSAKVMRIIIDPSRFNFDMNDLGNMNLAGLGLLLRPGATVTYNETDGSVTVKCSAGSETLSKNELSLLWLNLFVVQTSAAMTHPSDSGHQYIFDAIKDRIEERNVLGSTTVDEPSLYSVLYESPLPTYADSDVPVTTSASMLYFGDAISGIGINQAYPGLVSGALGLDLNSIVVPDGARVDDVNYILGGTTKHDAYTDSIITAHTYETGKNLNELRQMYQTAISESDTILVKLGYGNMMYFIMQSYTSILSGTAMPMDVTGFSIITQEIYNDVARVLGHIDGIAHKMLPESSDLLETYELYKIALDYGVYSALGYIDNYFKLVGCIYELNPDANIICIGMYDALDGFVYNYNGKKISLECDQIIQMCDSYTSYMLTQCRNTLYVNISDVHVNNTEIDVSNVRNFDSVMGATNLTATEHQVVSERILAQMSEGAEYSITLTIGNTTETYVFNYGEPVEISLPTMPGYVLNLNGVLPETMPAHNMQLTGSFVMGAYAIAYHANGGNGTMSTVTLSYDQEYTIADSSFDRPGYTFKGWNTKADGSGTSYYAGESVSMLSSDGNTIVLYAQWDSTSAQGDNTMIIIGGVVAALIVGIIAVMYFRRS